MSLFQDITHIFTEDNPYQESPFTINRDAGSEGPIQEGILLKDDGNYLLQDDGGEILLG